MPPPAAPDFDYADKNVNLPKSDWLNTYTAAGIAIQCWANNWAVHAQSVLRKGVNYASEGPAQIPYIQATTPYGVPISNGDRGNGLLCYILKSILGDDYMHCTICKTPAELSQEFGPNYQQYLELEPTPDPFTMVGATELMKRRIEMITDVCKYKRNCTDTDIYIAAALAQNGPGFGLRAIDPKDKNSIKNAPHGTTTYVLYWAKWFQDGAAIDTSTQLDRFKQAVDGLFSKGWVYPKQNIDMVEIQKLIQSPHNK